MITEVSLSKFTVFKQLDTDFSPGLNVFIGENSTGKTHLMKLLYSACSVVDGKIKDEDAFKHKLLANFLPDSIGRLATRNQGNSTATIKIIRKNVSTGNTYTLSSSINSTRGTFTKNLKNWKEDDPKPVIYIPVKDMLANAPGFLALYDAHDIHFEGIYADIINRASYPPTRGKRKKIQRELLNQIEAELSGTVTRENDQFYLKGREGQGNLEFTLLAEGYRKLGLLFCLIQNEMLTKGSILFWDEPEANLNPKLTRIVVEILYKLVDMGVQVFVATHDAMLTAQLELVDQRREKHVTQYHLFRKTDESEVVHDSYKFISEITGNPIQEAYNDLISDRINLDLTAL